MKKIAASFLFIFVFVAYGMYKMSNNASTKTLTYNTPVPVSTTSIPAVSVEPVVPSQNQGAAQPKKQPKNSVPASGTGPAPAANSTYADGVYTGDAVDANYGYIQVQATIKDGKIADVTFLRYPNDRNTSIEINGQAMPILKSEAISIQNANVDIVSGATDSSLAFNQSLGTALAQAKNL
jgi:uncharacterized protein with FMN-binding domain